ncbi:MAG: glutaredoxin 3 [Rhodothermales bacterium]|jgi:glutaredoxin 3
MPELTLYYSQTCPFCHRVTDFMEGAGIEIEMKDTRNPADRSELISIGGRATVPCLVIDGKALYESMDIIDWLRENAG